MESQGCQRCGIVRVIAAQGCSEIVVRKSSSRTLSKSDLSTRQGYKHHGHCLDLDLTIRTLLRLPVSRLCFGSHDAATPVTSRVLTLIEEALFDRLDDLGQLRFVLFANLGDGQSGSSLRRHR